MRKSGSARAGSTLSRCPVIQRSSSSITSDLRIGPQTAASAQVGSVGKSGPGSSDQVHQFLTTPANSSNEVVCSGVFDRNPGAGGRSATPAPRWHYLARAQPNAVERTMIQVQWHKIASAGLLLGSLFWPTAARLHPGSGWNGHVGLIVQGVRYEWPYDGRWIANVPPQGGCPASRMVLDVRGSSIRGTVVNPFGAFPITGSLTRGGIGTIQIVRMGGRIAFSKNRFVADYFNTCGPRHAVGARQARPSSGSRI